MDLSKYMAIECYDYYAVMIGKIVFLCSILRINLFKYTTSLDHCPLQIAASPVCLICLLLFCYPSIFIHANHQRLSPTITTSAA